MPLLPLTKVDNGRLLDRIHTELLIYRGFFGILVPRLVGNELPDRRVAQHALGLQMLDPHAQLGPKPLSRFPSSQWRLGERQFGQLFPSRPL
jgi:hypothetical protein